MSLLTLFKTNTLSLDNLSMIGKENMNQPFNSIPTMNDTFPAGSDTEGHYQTIDDAFRSLPVMMWILLSLQTIENVIV